MALQFHTLAFGAVAVTALVLFGIGHPPAEAPPSPTTPGLAVTPATSATSGPVASSVSAAGIVLTSTSVVLPISDRTFPAGPGMDVAQNNCTACHSPGMVLNQPRLTRAAWEGEVNKMRAAYKAPVDAADVPAIVAYLNSIRGVH